MRIITAVAHAQTLLEQAGRQAGRQAGLHAHLEHKQSARHAHLRCSGSELVNNPPPPGPVANMGSSDTTIWVVVGRRSGAGRRRALKALVAAGVVTCGAHEDLRVWWMCVCGCAFASGCEVWWACGYVHKFTENQLGRPRVRTPYVWALGT